MNNVVCKHGKLARKCVDCDLEIIEKENERLRECLRIAGLQAFMSNRPPEEVAEHLKEVSSSWEEFEKENNRLKHIEDCAKDLMTYKDAIINLASKSSDVRVYPDRIHHAIKHLSRLLLALEGNKST